MASVAVWSLIQHLFWDLSGFILIVSLATLHHLQLLLPRRYGDSLKLSSVVHGLVLRVLITRYKFPTFVTKFVADSVSQLDMSGQVLVSYLDVADRASLLWHQAIPTYKITL